MDILMQPSIIDKVFEFLGVIDIDRCQRVCRAWNECAIRKLRKCPPTDKCRFIIQREFWTTYKLGRCDGYEQREADKQMEKLIMENRMLNGVEFNEYKETLDDYVYYWYEEKALFSCRSSKVGVDNATTSFLEKDIKCVPSLSFMLYREEFDQLMRGISFNYPTVLVKQGTSSSAVAGKFLGSPKTHFRERKYPRVRRGNFSVDSFFEGFHINRYIPGHRITVTSWSDPESPRPDAGNPNFPIKSILYLISPAAEWGNEGKEIRQLLGESESTFLGGILDDVIESAIFLMDQKDADLQEASIITITFAGEQVESAILIIENEYEESFKEQIGKFQQNLNFRTDDGRVVGFFLDKRHWESGCYSGNLFATISISFPSVALVRLIVSDIFEPVDDPNVEASLLLVRF